MLLRKFSKSDHDLYLAYLLPLLPKDLTFKQTVEKYEIFGDNSFLFDRRFKCLNLAIREGEDIHMHTAIVNRMCNAFFYAKIHLELLSLLDKNPDIILHHLVDEYNNFRCLITDSNMIEGNETRACLIKKPESD
ncbi:unnamed protein product [Hymenolepis diminuta]|uniref:Uncharacterized protein n=1 Tax=Hymenolepis diminuta TaxID=6216 RepID=A0A564Z6R1_HYMDI|nr:unnamed protein product [Hymenolepis diminuta]